MISIKALRITSQPVIDAGWDKPDWRGAGVVLLEGYMGDKPTHFPRTQVKIACDDQALYVIFRVEDRYVRAVADDYQDEVYKDSCVEFFFAPDAESPRDYFNLEVNCGGAMLFQFHRASDGACIEVPESQCRRIEIAASLPKIIDPEIGEPTTWTVEYRLPLDILRPYCRVTEPTSGSQWRANFYKCADDSSHPHWLTWAPVDNPTPNFHLPEFFGILEF